jgi:hypothetical protein
MRHLRKLLIISFIILVLAVISRDRPAGVKVLVIDPISQDPEMIPSIVIVLDDPDYSVTHVIGGDVTVERLKMLEETDVLILRVHSSIKNDAVWVFTGERYDNNRYLVEQMTDEVHRARTSPEGEYLFAVGSSFFERYLSEMDGVEVLVMGCDAAQSRELADVFLGKGASLYVSWDGPVSLEYTDLVFSRILRYFLDGKTMEESVELVSGEMGADPHFQSLLRYYKQ